MIDRTKTVYVAYEKKNGMHGMVDAGPGATASLGADGTLAIKGPNADYEVDDVAYFTCEERTT